MTHCMQDIASAHPGNAPWDAKAISEKHPSRTSRCQTCACGLLKQPTAVKTRVSLQLRAQQPPSNLFGTLFDAHDAVHRDQ
eukprot:7512571-Pyramimonas_sp.AAC.1